MADYNNYWFGGNPNHDQWPQEDEQPEQEPVVQEDAAVNQEDAAVGEEDDAAVGEEDDADVGEEEHAAVGEEDDAAVGVEEHADVDGQNEDEESDEEAANAKKDFNGFCNICGKKYTKSATVIDHQKMHRGAKTNCPHCPRKFMNQSQVSGHVDRRH